jgi:CRISPR-associated protein Cst1
MISREIILFPSNWIYNAGVIGFLRVLDELNVPVVNSIRDDGSIILTQFPDVEDIFKKWVELSPKSKKGKSLVYGWKDAYYANQTEKLIKKRIMALIEGYKNEDDKRSVILSCCFCLQKMKVKKMDVVNLNQAFGNILLGSEKTFVNMYWANEPKDFVCPKCNFIVMCHHLAFTPLSDGSKIFINAPSFNLMYNLNKFAAEIFGSIPLEKGLNKRNILAMSIIEYATKIQVTLGIWARMNIEIISLSRHRNRGQKIEVFSLPYDVVNILFDRRIASLLSEIGELEILNIILEQKFSQLSEFGYDLLRFSLVKSGERESSLKNRIMQKYNRIIEKRSSGELTKLAEKMFQLYALIEEKRRRENYGFFSSPKN